MSKLIGTDCNHMVDCDDTLILWGKGASWTFNKAVLEQMERAKYRGQTVVVWTAGGTNWISKIQQLMLSCRYDHLVDYYMCKPMFTWDDKAPEEWTRLCYPRENE